MKKTASYFLAIMLLATPDAASTSENIPDTNLRVTIQYKADGKVIDGFHILELSCRYGKCSLASVSLNQCGDVGAGKQAFNPAQQYASTSIGNLKAKNEGKSIVVQETGSDMVGDYIKNLRFDYEPRNDDKPVTRLTGFSGSYVKNSAALNKVFSIEYVPLPKANQIMKLDCGALLPGIDKK
jgi:hypothetical protein